MTRLEVDLFLHNGLVVTERDTFRGGVAVRDGKIVALTSDGELVEAKEDVDLRGRVLLPGAIDSHSHFSEPGRENEGFLTGSKAAAAGGVTTVLDMPLNDLPPTTSRERLDEKKRLVQGKSVVDYALWGGLIDDNLADLKGMHDGGVVAFKAFMRTIADFPRIDDGLMYAGMDQIRAMGSVLGVHAENESVTSFLKSQLQKAGRRDRGVWPASRPPEQELEAIRRAIYWAEVTGARLHVLHVSIRKGVEAVVEARARGASVTVETCGHYLFFDADDHLAMGPYAKAAPPLRSRAEVEALWECVLKGQVDTIASDHSPFPPERHLKGLDDPWEGGGITGNQTYLPAVITAGIHGHGLTWPALSRMTSANPARIFGLYPKKGAVLPGSDADFTVIDPEKEWVLEAHQLFNRHQLGPYVGKRFKGKIERTIVRGVTVYEGGEIRAQPGHGRLLERES